MATITGYTKVGAEAKFTHKAQLDADTTTNINNGVSATRGALNTFYVRFVDQDGNPLPAGSTTTIRINTVTGDIDDITFEEA